MSLSSSRAKSFDGGAVKGDAFFKGVFQFFGDDGHAFQNAQNVGEPQPHEFHVALLRYAQNVFNVFVVVFSVVS